MARRHNSFLVRCWDLDSDTQRIEIEHIQSGRKVLAKSAAAAVEWICAQSTDVAHQNPAPGHPDSVVKDVGKGGPDD